MDIDLSMAKSHRTVWGTIKEWFSTHARTKRNERHFALLRDVATQQGLCSAHVKLSASLQALISNVDPWLDPWRFAELRQKQFDNSAEYSLAQEHLALAMKKLDKFESSLQLDEQISDDHNTFNLNEPEPKHEDASSPTVPSLQEAC